MELDSIQRDDVACADSRRVVGDVVDHWLQRWVAGWHLRCRVVCHEGWAEANMGRHWRRLEETHVGRRGKRVNKKAVEVVIVGGGWGKLELHTLPKNQ